MSHPKQQAVVPLPRCKRETTSPSTSKRAVSMSNLQRLRSLPAWPTGRNQPHTTRAVSSPNMLPWFHQPPREPSHAHHCHPERTTVILSAAKEIGRAHV